MVDLSLGRMTVDSPVLSQWKAQFHSKPTGMKRDDPQQSTAKVRGSDWSFKRVCPANGRVYFKLSGKRCWAMNHKCHVGKLKCHESWCLRDVWKWWFFCAIHAEAIIGNSSYGPLMGGITMVSLCGWRSSPPQRINHDPFRFHRYCVYIPNWVECPETLVWGNLCLSQQGICKMMLMSRGFQNCWKLKLKIGHLFPINPGFD